MHLISRETPRSSPATGRDRTRAGSQASSEPLSHSLELKSQPLAISGTPEGQGVSPGLPVSAQMRCRIVCQLTAEMLMLVSERVQMRRDRRRAACHVRQIAMYICHVVLQQSLTDIGTAFGRDRTTVGHACNVVEDRRDDKAYDEFVAAIERVVISVFGAIGGSDNA